MAKKFTRAEQERRILGKFRKLFKDKPADKQFLAEQVYPQAAFCISVAHELMEQVNEQGIIGKVVNGNGIAKDDTTPAYKELKDTMRTINSCIDTLGKLCPEIKKDLRGETDELLNFIGKGK